MVPKGTFRFKWITHDPGARPLFILPERSVARIAVLLPDKLTSRARALTRCIICAITFCKRNIARDNRAVWMMAKVEGVEPSFSVLETDVLPLNYTPVQTGGVEPQLARGSQPAPQALGRLRIGSGGWLRSSVLRFMGPAL